MAFYITFFLFFLGLLIASLVWIVKASIALFRRERRVLLYCGTPIALVTAALAVRELVLGVFAYAVAYFNAGSGRG
jgi:hypothetical protein